MLRNHSNGKSSIILLTTTPVVNMRCVIKPVLRWLFCAAAMGVNYAGINAPRKIMTNTPKPCLTTFGRRKVWAIMLLAFGNQRGVCKTISSKFECWIGLERYTWEASLGKYAIRARICNSTKMRNFGFCRFNKGFSVSSYTCSTIQIHAWTT